MVASDLLKGEAPPWLYTNGRAALRIAAPMPILAVAWWLHSMQLGNGVWVCLFCYALANLALIALLQRDGTQMPSRRSHIFAGLAGVDGVLALLLVWQAGPLSGVVPVLFFVLTLKVLCYQHQYQWMSLVPTLVGPLYLVTMAFTPHPAVWQNPSTRSAFATLLLGSGVFSLAMLESMVRRRSEQKRLVQQLVAERSTYEARIAEMHSVTNDLRARIRSQQALEESLRAITGSLSLSDVLQHILDSTTQMLGPERVDGAALTLYASDIFTDHLLLVDTSLGEGWAQPLARHVLDSRNTLLIGDTKDESAWQMLHAAGITSAMSIPMTDQNGQIVGALSVVGRQPHAFSPAEARHLNAFGIQASVAIRNAELHSQLRNQWSLLEAVLRDLGDGLVVYDTHGEMVLANAVAERILMHDHTAPAVQAQLDKLIADVQQDIDQMRWCEVQDGGAKEDEHVYQVFASQTHVGDDLGNHVAVILHDITDQKIEERARTEFISMVSHELRNPLHTLSGFLKLVLQGRAGALTPLQHDFLQTAEEQVEKLNGRINELLEFNRINAGRLRLQREWSELPGLIQTTTNALALQTEQAGLALINDVPDELPELLMDSKRIGQVLTNLVENAVKATPSGSITLNAEVYDSFVRVSVSDTGVGIASTDARKIFDPFYSTGFRSSMYGVHLGLGLSICQQIVQGHGGRIWVESEEGQGSTFIFTLPVVAREHELLLNAA